MCLYHTEVFVLSNISNMGLITHGSYLAKGSDEYKDDLAFKISLKIKRTEEKKRKVLFINLLSSFDFGF